MDKVVEILMKAGDLWGYSVVYKTENIISPAHYPGLHHQHGNDGTLHQTVPFTAVFMWHDLD